MTWPTKKLGGLLEKTGNIPIKIKRGQYKKIGIYPVIDQGEDFIAGYIDDREDLYEGELPIVIFGDHTRILKYVDFPFAVGADGTKILRPKQNLLPKFLYYTLIIKPVPNLGYKRHFSLLRQQKISLLPLEIQKHIVGRLDAIQEAQKMNDRLIEKADELFQSLLHYELDPTDKDWKVEKLEKLLDKWDAGTWGEEPQSTSDGIMILRSTNFANDGQLDFTNIARKTIDEKKIKKLQLENDDILLEKSGGGPNQPVGRVVLFFSPDNETYTFANFIQRLRAKLEVDSHFLFYYLLRLYKSNVTVRLQSQTSGIRNLKLNLYLKILIPVPPLEIQRQIVVKLDSVQQYKSQLLAQKAKLKELFDSVLAKSMKGEMVS